MSDAPYIMEGEEEALRLDLKTDPKILQSQALWAGLKPGMRVADLGCGPGKTSFHLNQMVQPKGAVSGIDISKQRIDYAITHYRHPSLDFEIGDIRKPLTHLGTFDFIWVRFVLEHHRSSSFQIVENISKILKPGGILCLIDLDYNCLSHYGMPGRLETSLFGVMEALQGSANFDPYVGRKLYSFLYDLKYSGIEVMLSAHHLIFGRLNKADEYNWIKKVEIAAKDSGYPFNEYEDGFEGFLSEFKQYFSHPRRFTYTPLIACRGCKAGATG
ncbi:MAG: methyltransferase domain-containing protein [Desulfobacterales bacterium]|nr:methyltransferase domain-containing protein [Desulfobacterales bacterium]